MVTKEHLDALRARRESPAPRLELTPTGPEAQEAAREARQAHESAIRHAETALSQAGARFEASHSLARLRGQPAAHFNHTHEGPKP